MAFDQTTRNRLQRFVTDARRVLEEEFTRQLQNDYGLDPRSGTASRLESLRHINDQQRETARILRDTLAHYCASSDIDTQAALDRIVREQAFTILNRLAALRMAEARGLLIESVGNGYQAKGFQLYVRLAGTGLGETGDAYRVYLQSIFDEFALDLPGLFDRYSAQGRLFPREAALLQVLGLINDGEIEPLWAEDETIGWIYQYFNSKEERKAMREASQAPRNSRELAVRNQFFTPRYVVEFLVDNTLGRLWFNWTGGQTALRSRCRYLLVKPDEQAEAAKRLRDPRTVKLLDPACGSMHFGLYAFDLFQDIYREAWDWEQAHGPAALDRETGGRPELKPLSETYADKDSFLRDVPRLIIERNVYGVDIDPRAAQIASLALWLRAQRAWHEVGVRAKDRPQVGHGHVVAAVAPPAEVELRKRFMRELDPRDAELFEQTLFMLRGLPELGMLLQIEKKLPTLIRQVFGKHGPMFSEEDMTQWRKAESRLRETLAQYAHAARSTFQDRLFAEDAMQGLRLIDHCREIFDVVVMNPPFGALGTKTKEHLGEFYPSSKNDLLAIFVERGLSLVRSSGRVGAITSRTCFFVASFSEWREKIISNFGQLSTLVDLGHGVMDDAMVEAAAYTLSPTRQLGDPAEAIRVISENDKEVSLSECAEAYRRNVVDKRIFKCDTNAFKVLSDAPFVYWVNPETLLKVASYPTFEPEVAQVRKGLRTGDNFRFVRALWEIPARKLTTDITHQDGVLQRQKAYWVPLVLSGSSQPWYSPILVALNWKEDGKELRRFVTKYGTPSRLIQAEDFYFRGGMSWTLRAARFVPYSIPAGCIPTGSRPMAFPAEGKENLALAFSASRFASAFMRFYGDWFSRPKFLEGKLKLLPWPTISDSVAKDLDHLAQAEALRRRRLYQGHEPFIDFVLPFPLLKDTENQQVSINWRTLLSPKIEKKIEEQYQLTSDEVEDLYRDLDEALDARIAPATAEEDDSENDEGDDVILDTSPRSAIEAVVSYAVGCAFGHWDVRYAIGDKPIPAPAQPFDPLPNCAPGRLKDDSGLPASEGRLIDFIDRHGQGYPLPLPTHGIISSEKCHQASLEESVQTVLRRVFEVPEAFEGSICSHLGVRSLGDYLTRPNLFFSDHLNRYTKSRRKAPIYWPLSTSSGSYTLWFYYPSLTNQTLYTAVNDFLEPKVKQVSRDTAALREKGATRSREDEKTLEALQILELELIELRDTLLQIAPTYRPNHDDGVQITAAPLWQLFRHKPWQKILKDTWAKLEKGDYDWAHLAKDYWPGRVREKCKTDKSLAIAHGLENLYLEPEAKPKKAPGRKKAGGTE